MLHSISKFRYHLLLLATGLIAAYVYVVVNTWSPSSYGYVMESILKVEDTKTIGQSRSIRSDEWAVVTPLTQATINNHFERFNQTSLYQEDLRINYGLPIHDWGFIFKPTMWLFGLVNPAYAYSAHWFVLTALFVSGYALLFRWLGMGVALSVALSLGLFFTGFVQFWWNEKGPLFALFPWILWPFSRNWPFPIKVLVFYWIATSWFLTNLYPPVQVSLAFVGLCILYGKEKNIFRLNQQFALLILATLASAATAGIYLWDYLQLTANTFYPGNRHVSGGSITWDFFVSWFFPAINFTSAYESLIGRNICEIGVVGSYYFLLGLVFLNYKNVKAIFTEPSTKHLVLTLLVGLILMSMWLFLPLPSWVGLPLLWDNVTPERMQYAFGVLLFCFCCVVIQHLGLTFSWVRILILPVICGYFYLLPPSGMQTDVLHWMSISALLFGTFGLWLISKKYALSSHFSIAVLAGALGVGIFAGFNPLQSAWPIFNFKPNEVTKKFDEMTSYNQGILAVIGLPGAVGNGLGYKSLSHVTAVPQMNFWRDVFPEMNEIQLNQVFNRYSHIVPTEMPMPAVITPDSVSVPVNSLNKVIPVKYLDEVYAPIQLGGYVDRVSVEGNYYVVDGWAPWFGPMGSRHLEVMIQPVKGKPLALSVNRPDLPVATGGMIRSMNGFKLRIPIDPKNTPTAMCLISYDVSSQKRTLLNNPPNLPYCATKPK
jgi:hypothetical protein